MFTGLVEAMGIVHQCQDDGAGVRLRIAEPTVAKDAPVGASIAVNGVCLTVVDSDASSLVFQAGPETLRCTNLGQLGVGDRVNLERSLRAGDQLGGHIVQGHVDGTGEFIEARQAGAGWVVRVGFPPELGRYIVEKGSIAVDGISLTVAALEAKWFEIAIIPHTWSATNLGTLERGAPVNLEVDIIAKYVERLLAQPLGGAGLTIEKLKELGY